MDDSLAEIFSLGGRHALITGGGGGIGREIALTLAAAGARISVIGRREAPLAETVALIKKQHPAADAAALTADVSDLSAIPAFMRQLSAQHGAPDILINNAGNNPRLAIADITPETWQKTLDVNLSAALFLAQAAAPAMMQNGWGRILNIASLQAKLAFENGAAYGAAKGGIAQLTRAMAREWSHAGICANAIAPGFFPTDLTAPVLKNAPEKAAQLAARTAMGRNGKLADLRGAVLLLTTAAGDYITGQTLYIDGGFTVV